LVYVATKPSRLFQDIRPDENLHLLPITGNLPPNYTAVTITSDDYPELVSKDAPVETVAVGTVLVAYNWPNKSERYQRVNGFVQAFFANLQEIKARRPKWKDFDVTASVSGWTRFPAAEEWLKKTELTPGTATARSAESGSDSRQATSQAQIPLDPEHDALFREFAAYQRNPVDPKQREALFRDFAEYQKRQHQIIIAYRGTASDH
jgi:hypothetical protein